MPEIVPCKICGKRRAKRHCPAVHGDICPICCGNERETSLTCPLECEYLQQAHEREDPAEVEPEALLYPEIQITEEFLVEQEELLMFSLFALLQAALRTPGAADSDVTEALVSLIRTHRTKESGLVYESYPDNRIAANVQRSFSASFDDYSKLKREKDPLKPIPNSDVLKTLLFLHRLGLQNNNGRPKGRKFIDLMFHMTPEAPPEQEPFPSLLV